MNKYRKKIKQKNKYREYIRVLNGVLQLTEREIDVLSILMELDEEWPKSRLKQKNIYSTDSRKYIMDVTSITKTNLTKYSNKFVDAGVVIKDADKKASINPIFKAKDLNNAFEIMFILDYKEEL